MHNIIVAVDFLPAGNDIYFEVKYALDAVK